MKLLLSVLIVTILFFNNKIFAQDSLKTSPISRIDFRQNRPHFFYINNQRIGISKINNYFTNYPLAKSEYNKFLSSRRNQTYYIVLSCASFIGSQILYRNKQETTGGIAVGLTCGSLIAAIFAKRHKITHLFKAACFYNQAN